MLQFLELVGMPKFDILTGNRLKEEVCFGVAGTHIAKLAIEITFKTDALQQKLALFFIEKMGELMLCLSQHKSSLL